MKRVKFNEYLTEVNNVLPSGAFLTVKTDDEINTMTIGWATIGIIWSKPIMVVLVRKSRHTYRLIEKAADFTVSFVFDGQMKKELSFCGTKSGRDYDKFKECNLEIIPGRKVKTPVITSCDLHYECEIKYKQAMNPDNLAREINNNNYPGKDYHTLYFGEIVDCYLEE